MKVWELIELISPLPADLEVYVEEVVGWDGETEEAPLEKIRISLIEQTKVTISNLGHRRSKTTKDKPVLMLKA